MIGGLEASCKALRVEFDCDIWILSLLHKPIRENDAGFSLQVGNLGEIKRPETHSSGLHEL
tara:strand:- start:14 stop:196 length:183 start_codon:yes stop_codon:yes gene_type:complete